VRQLTKLGVLEKVGKSGRAAHYIIAKAKLVLNPSQGEQTGDEIDSNKKAMN